MRRSFHSRLFSGRDELLEEPWLRSLNPNFVGADLYPLHKRLEVVASETALPIPDLFAGLDPKTTQKLRRHAIVVALAAIFGPVRIGPCRITDSLQLDNPSLEVGIVHFSKTILNGLIQVLLDLIQRAKTELFIVSFVAYDVPSVISAINSAIDRGVEARILVEASLTEGGSLLVDPVATMRRCVPSALLYSWTDRPHPFTNGRVHAKVAVADSDAAFLTSANLTGHALEKNMEAGVFVTGGHIPVSLRAHLHALVETKVIRPV